MKNIFTIAFLICIFPILSVQAEDKEENVFLKGKSECEKLFNKPHTD